MAVRATDLEPTQRHEPMTSFEDFYDPEIAINDYTEPYQEDATEPNKPFAVRGEILVGRVTKRLITSEDFLGSSVLINLSNSDITRIVNRNSVIVRRKTEPEDVVKAVMKISHGDEYSKVDSKIDDIVHGLMDDFHSAEIDLNDKFIVQAIEGMFIKYEKTDLMRGMDAFADAEYDQHQNIYASTIIRPARLLASWMISRESSPEHVYFQ